MNILSKTKQIYAQATCTERLASLLAFFIGTALVYLQQYMMKAGDYRIFTVILTGAFTIAGYYNSSELYNRLKEKARSNPNSLPILRAAWKIQAECLGMIALLGFVASQYRTGAAIDKGITGSEPIDPLYWAVIQSILLIGLLLAATIAVSRKLALAKFEFDETKAKTKEKIRQIVKERKALEKEKTTAQSTAANKESPKNSGKNNFSRLGIPAITSIGILSITISVFRKLKRKNYHKHIKN